MEYPIEEIDMDELCRLLKCCEISPKFAKDVHFFSANIFLGGTDWF